MSRAAREYSESGLYHIVFRGINKQGIFEEEIDYQHLKKIIKELKDELHFEIYVYCFMTNHVHLLLKELQMGDISLIMKRILTRYVMYYNRKYQRTGTLITNRYKSQPVEIDDYFLAVVRYIHQNPLKAHMVSDIGDYRWSSYNEYVKNLDGLADKNFVLQMLNIDEFVEFHQIEETEIFDVSDRLRISDEQIKREIKLAYSIEPGDICKLTKQERNRILRELKKKYSIRQVERVSGVSRGIIYKS